MRSINEAIFTENKYSILTGQRFAGLPHGAKMDKINAF